MSKLATFAVAVAALVLAFVTLSPSSAEAGWRRGHWGGPGVSVYIGPRYGYYGGYYGPRRYYGGYAYGYPYGYYPYWRSRAWNRWY
jgi:hypothetical protein